MHRIIHAIASILCIAYFSCGATLSYSTQLRIFVGGILLFGIPHGALDILLIPNASIGLAYFVLFALMLVMWKIVPNLSLVVYWLLSIYHFGNSNGCVETKHSPLAHALCNELNAKHLPLAHVILRGGVFLNCVLYKKDVQTILSILNIHSCMYWVLCGMCSCYWMYVGATMVQLQYNARQILHCCLLGVGYWKTPLMIAFTLDFSLDHSIRHIMCTLQKQPISIPSMLAWIALMYCIVGYTTLLVFVDVLKVDNLHDNLHDNLNSVFLLVVLYGLSVPHALLHLMV